MKETTDLVAAFDSYPEDIQNGIGEIDPITLVTWLRAARKLDRGEEIAILRKMSRFWNGFHRHTMH